MTETDTGNPPTEHPEAVFRAARSLPIQAGRLWLLPEAAALEPQSNTLLVADVHLGKADSFRRLGVPVPNGTNERNLARLSDLLNRYQPAHLVFLGDLVHDRLPPTHTVYRQLARWRELHGSVQMTLIIGNHDHRAGALPHDCQIRSVMPGERLGPLTLMHEPNLTDSANCQGHGVAGHIHPVVRIRSGQDSVRVRCFWARPGLTVMPAFGEFTGGYRINAEPNDQIFIPNHGTVHRLPSTANFPA